MKQLITKRSDVEFIKFIKTHIKPYDADCRVPLSSVCEVLGISPGKQQRISRHLSLNKYRESYLYTELKELGYCLKKGYSKEYYSLYCWRLYGPEYDESTRDNTCVEVYNKLLQAQEVDALTPKQLNEVVERRERTFRPSEFETKILKFINAENKKRKKGDNISLTPLRLTDREKQLLKPALHWDNDDYIFKELQDMGLCIDEVCGIFWITPIEEENLYDDLGGDGEGPVYLSEGIWVYPDGSMSED